MTALLCVIFITFIGVGLPDSVLGSAWPAMYPAFGVPISLAGYISATVSAFTTVSSLVSARAIARFGTGLVTAVSTLMTALALLGYGLTQHATFFFLLAVPLGLGAGTIDTALNAFVALHYSAAQMSFLHCFYGIGVAASPLIISLALGPQNDWRRGYLTVALIQFCITAAAFAALPLWKKAENWNLEENGGETRTLSLRQMARRPGVRMSCLTFFAACGLELTAGSWASSYFVNTCGLAVDAAARTPMLFYVGLAGGRFLSGMLAGKWGRRRILLVSMYILLGALALFLLPLPTPVRAAALLLVGLGIGPIYPNLAHLTPDLFGQEAAPSVMGVQQAVTYVGVMVMPWFFGVMAERFSTALLPAYLMFQFVLYAWSFRATMRYTQKDKAS